LYSWPTVISMKMFGWLISRYIYCFSMDDVWAIECTASVGPNAQTAGYMLHAAVYLCQQSHAGIVHVTYQTCFYERFDGCRSLT
jgi:hypothetical protein